MTCHSPARFALTALVVSLATSAGAAPLLVVTDIAPVQSLTAMVMAGAGQPDVLAGPGTDPHDMQLRPSQVAALTGADVVIRVGPALTPWLETPLAQAERARVVNLLDAAGTTARTYPDGATDPHAWLDPQNAAAWVAAIAGALAEEDPANAALYRANAQAARDSIGALDAELATTLAPAAGVPIMTGHDAFGHFAARYDLNIAAAIEDGQSAQAGAARLASLRESLEGAEAVCVFPETGGDPAMAAMLTDGTGVRLGAALDPEGVNLPSGAALYPVLMRNLAQAIKDCVAP